MAEPMPAPLSAAPPPAVPVADPKAALMASLRAVLSDRNGGALLSTPYAIDALRMILSNVPFPEIVKRLGDSGVLTSVSVLKRLKQGASALSPELKAKLEASKPVVSESDDKSAFQTLKVLADSVAGRILAIEAEIKLAKDTNQPFPSKRDDQLMKLYTMLSEFRKDLERQRLESEVVQAYKRAAVDMCMIAMEFIDDGKKAEFLEKVRAFEQANL